MKRTFLFFITLAAALALSACSLTVGPPASDIAADIDAGLDRNEPAISDGSLASGSSRLYKVAVSTEVAAQDVIQIELNTATDAMLTVYDSPLSIVRLASSSADWFGETDDPDLEAAAAGIDTQAIGVLSTCRGACILMPSDDVSTFYVRVAATGDLDAYSLYVFGTEYVDTDEPNNTPDTAVDVPLLLGLGDASGAIEVIGDTDWFRPDGTFSTVSLTLGASVPEELDLIATIHPADGSSEILATLDRDNPDFSGPADRYYVEVSAVSDRAAVSSRSAYYPEVPSGVSLVLPSLPGIPCFCCVALLSTG